MSKITAEEALRLGLFRFRELHAQGSLPAGVEDRFTFNIRPSAKEHTLQICLWEREDQEPVVYFEAIIDRDNRSIRVTKDVATDENPGNEQC